MNIVDDIRNSNLSGKDLTEKYKLAKSTISEIRNNKIWKEERRETANIPMDIDIYELSISEDGCVSLTI